MECHQVPLPGNHNPPQASVTAPAETTAATDQSAKQLADQSADQSAEPSRSSSMSPSDVLPVVGSPVGAEAERREKLGKEEQHHGENEAGLAWLEGPAGLLRVMLIDRRLLARGPNVPVNSSSSNSDSRKGGGDDDSSNSGRPTAAVRNKTMSCPRSNDTAASDLISRSSEPSGGVMPPSPSPPPPLLLAGLASWARSARRRKACSSSPGSSSFPPFFPAFTSPSYSAASSYRSFYSASSMEQEGLHIRSGGAERSKGYLPQANGCDGASLAQPIDYSGDGGGHRGTAGGSGTGGGSIVERPDGITCDEFSEKDFPGKGGAIERRDGFTCDRFSEEELWREGDQGGSGPGVSSGGSESPRGGGGAVDAAERKAAPSSTARATAGAVAAATETVGVSADTTAAAELPAVTAAQATATVVSAEATTAAAAAAAGTASYAVTSTSEALSPAPEAATYRGALMGSIEAQKRSENSGGERRLGGRRGGGGVTENGFAHEGEQGGRKLAARGKRERPCRELELFQLGNLDGPLKIVPNRCGGVGWNGWGGGVLSRSDGDRAIFFGF